MAQWPSMVAFNVVLDGPGGDIKFTPMEECTKLSRKILAHQDIWSIKAR